MRGIASLIVLVASLFLCGCDQLNSAVFHARMNIAHRDLKPTAVDPRDDFALGKDELVNDRPDHPFPEATQVRLFISTGYRPLSDGQLEPVWLDTKGRLLTADERTQFEARLYRRATLHEASEGRGVVACCDPHHFFRYYDAKGRQVGELGVCFCCGCLERIALKDGNLTRTMAYAFEAEGFKYHAMKRWIASLGLPTDEPCKARETTG